MRDPSQNSVYLSALTLSTSLVEDAMKSCPAAEHLKQGRCGLYQNICVHEEEFLHLLIHTSFVPSVHLLDPAAASALEIIDTKVGKLQTRPCRAHKTRHKASIRIP